MAANGHRGRAARFAARRLTGRESSDLHGWLPGRRGIARLGLCLVAAFLTVALTHGWRPQFLYRLGYTPQRDVRVGTPFTIVDELATARAEDEASKAVPSVFVNDVSPLDELPDALLAELRQLAAAKTLADLDNQLRRDFGFALTAPKKAEVINRDAAEQQIKPQTQSSPPSKSDGVAPVEAQRSPDEELESQFQAMRNSVSTPDARQSIKVAVTRAVEPLRKNGVLSEAHRQALRGLAVPQDVISVRNDNSSEEFRQVRVADVLREVQASATGPLDAQRHRGDLDPEVAERIFQWLRNRLPTTLTYDDEATQRMRVAARNAVLPVTVEHKVGDQIVPKGTPISSKHLSLLKLEYDYHLAGLSLWDRAKRFAASLGMVGLLFLMCALHIVRNETEIVRSMGRLSVLLGLVVATVAASTALNTEPFYAEIVPLVVSGMVLAVAYSLEFGLLIAFALSLVITQSIGGDLGRFVVLIGTTATAVLSVGKVRSRTKFTTVGFYAGFACFALVWCTGVVESQGMQYLVRSSFLGLFWGVSAGLIVTGLLPFVERVFGVLTDISLLELADVAHPLLQELVRRAPGTWNHSHTVATLAERAADRIGANDVLVRVGAYFHDIGKMLKPHYFIENQGGGSNRHDQLAPAMSTLIIIGHVKDGADLAREHHLPEPIVDFIEQHHGTTLVEYFYHGATKHRNEPGYSNLEESAFRYPGPKPQSKEAGVLMLADCVESASRTLSEPTPARIENLVEKLGMKLLLDGQFDESGLDLREIRDIQDSLIKSLTSVYHGRIKYPGAA